MADVSCWSIRFTLQRLEARFNAEVDAILSVMLLQRLHRTTRDGRWFREIDGLRFLAIASVLLFHLIGEIANRSGQRINIQPRYIWLSTILGNGDRGVRLFFVISGFVLALPFARALLHGGRAVSIRKFYLRRLTRLEPPYLIALGFIAFATWVYFHHFEPGYGIHWLSTATYSNGLIYHAVSMVSPVTWSLEVEVQFYLLAPLFMLLLRLRPASLRRGIFLALIACCGWIQIHYFWDNAVVAYSVLFYVQYFLAGLLAADIYVLDGEKLRAGIGWDAFALAAIALTALTPRELKSAHFMMPYVFGGVCLAAFNGPLFRRFLSVEWVAVIGGMCYSIYLLHFTFYAILFKFTRHFLIRSDMLLSLLSQIVLLLLPTLLLCTLFFFLVEQPCMDPDWPSHFWRKLTGHRSRTAEKIDSAGISS